MTYSTGTLNLISGRGFGTEPALWVYTNTDAHTDVDGTDYFTDGDAKGMKVNDVVLVIDTNASPVTCTVHAVITVTAGGAATIAAATLA